MKQLRSVRPSEIQHCKQVTASVNNTLLSKLVFCDICCVDDRKLQKMTLSSRPCVCLSTCQQHWNRWTDFHVSSVLVQFVRDVRTPDMNTGHIMCATGAKLAECVWGREMFGAKVAGATATHFEFSAFLRKFPLRMKETSPYLQTTLVCLLHRPSLNGIRVGRDSSVGVATRYGLDGPGIESQLGPDFPHTSIPTVGLTKTPAQWMSGLSPGGKADGAWLSLPTLI